MEQTKHSSICKLRRVSYSSASLINTLQYSRLIVYNVYKRLDEFGQKQRTAHNPKSDKNLTLRCLAGFIRSVKAYPTMSFSTGV